MFGANKLVTACLMQIILSIQICDFREDGGQLAGHMKVISDVCSVISDTGLAGMSRVLVAW